MDQTSFSTEALLDFSNIVMEGNSAISKMLKNFVSVVNEFYRYEFINVLKNFLKKAFNVFLIPSMNVRNNQKPKQSYDVQSHAGSSSTPHQQPCDRDGFHNRVTLTFDLLTSGLTHAERLP